MGEGEGISIQYSVIGNSVGVIVMWILGGDKGSGKGEVQGKWVGL